jgi:hypothetical protein
MSSEVAAAYLTLRASSAELGGDIAKARNFIVDSMHSLAAEVAGIFVIGGGIFAGISALRDWINVAAEGEEVAARFHVAMANMGDQVGYTSEQFEKLIAQTQAMGTAGRSGVEEAGYALLKSGNIRGENFARAMELAQDLAGTMRGDVSQAAQQLSRELEDPVRAMMRLRREGIVVPTVIKEQILAAKELGDVMGEQRILMDFLATRYKGYGEAFQGTFLGQWQKFQGILDQIKEDLVTSFLPAFKPIVGIAQELLVRIEANKATIDSWGQTATYWVGQVAAWFKDKLIAAWDLFEISMSSSAGWDASQDQIAVWISEAMDAFKRLGEYIGVIFKALGTTFDNIFDAIVGKLSDWLHGTHYMAGTDIGKLAADTFTNEMTLGMRKLGDFNKYTDSAGTAILKDQLKSDLDKYQTMKDALDKGKYASPNLGKPGSGMPPPTPNTDYDIAESKFKYSFTGLADLSKKMQEGITGGSMEALTKDQLAEAKKATGHLGSLVEGQNKMLENMETGVKGGFAD